MKYFYVLMGGFTVKSRKKGISDFQKLNYSISKSEDFGKILPLLLLVIGYFFSWKSNYESFVCPFALGTMIFMGVAL